MTPGKLPHAKRFNVQKDDRLPGKGGRGTREQDEEARESAAA